MTRTKDEIIHAVNGVVKSFTMMAEMARIIGNDGKPQSHSRRIAGDMILAWVGMHRYGKTFDEMVLVIEEGLERAKMLDGPDPFAAMERPTPPGLVKQPHKDDIIISANGDISKDDAKRLLDHIKAELEGSDTLKVE